MKRAIVLGATSGIGKELALILAKKGYRVGIAGRRTALLDELCQQDSSLLAQHLDISDKSSAVENLKALIHQLGGLDLLVISSGYGDINKNLTHEIEHKTIEVNVAGFTAIANYAYNYFKEQDSGHLVGISSIMGLRGSAAAPAYSASKAYQINYLESLRIRAAAEGAHISITDIRPGSVNTDMMKGEGHFWISSPTKAAKLIFSAIKRKSPICYVSRRWVLIAILLQLLPHCLYKRMAKM